MREGIWEAANAASGAQRNENDYPFIDHQDTEAVLDWLRNDLDDKVESRQERLEIIERLDKMFEGEPYEVGFKSRDENDDGTTRKKSSIFNYFNSLRE